MRTFLSIILLGISVFLLGACAKKEVAEEMVTVTPPEETGERVEKGFTHVQTEEGKVVLKVEGDAVNGLDTGKVTIKNPRVERLFYKGDKENSVKMEARTGTWNKNDGQVQVEDGVKGTVKFEEEITIEHADKMIYDPLTHTLDLSGKVRIKQARSVLNADEVIIYLDKEGKGIVKIMAKGKVTGRIFPEELKKKR